MRVQINGKYWELKFKHPGSGTLGKCDHPETPGKSITIHPSLRGESFLDVLLHETLHAIEAEETFSRLEEEINATATDQARLICRKEVLVRFLDDPKLLDQAKEVLEKHGWSK